jgi:hypothetical protein
MFCLLFASACTNAFQPIQTKHTPYLNKNEFTGLQSLGDSFEAVQLDYSLDSSFGEELPLNSCIAVIEAKMSDIDSSQFHLLQLMKINCTAAKYYFSAMSNGEIPTAFPIVLTESFVKSLPGTAVPDLGGESMEKREGTLAEVEPTLQVLNLSQGAVKLALAGDLVVDYLIMARGDFDQDGYEDLLLRLDWYISTAFGKGFDLIMLSQTPEDEQPKIVWRK